MRNENCWGKRHSYRHWYHCLVFGEWSCDDHTWFCVLRRRKRKEEKRCGAIVNKENVKNRQENLSIVNVVVWTRRKKVNKKEFSFFKNTVDRQLIADLCLDIRFFHRSLWRPQGNDIRQEMYYRWKFRSTWNWSYKINQNLFGGREILLGFLGDRGLRTFQMCLFPYLFLWCDLFLEWFFLNWVLFLLLLFSKPRKKIRLDLCTDLVFLILLEYLKWNKNI